MESTIFFGNGVNLLCKDGKSWDNVLRQISQRQVLPPIGDNTVIFSRGFTHELNTITRDFFSEINGSVEKNDEKGSRGYKSYNLPALQ